MNKIDVAIGQPTSLNLSQALLLYKGDNSNHLVTVHNVEHTKSGPVLGPGHEMTARFAEALFRELHPKKYSAKTRFRFIPSRVIGFSSEMLVWHLPSGKRPMRFQSKNKLDTFSGESFFHPNLLFVATKTKFRVFALRQPTAKPNVRTKLFLAPYPNIWDDGTLCWGGGAPKTDFDVDAIDRYEEAFFSVPFSHLNYQSTYVRHEEGVVGVWCEMKDAKRFPPSWLVPTKLTLASVLGC